MDVLIWLGAALSLSGVGALLWCVIYTVRARRNSTDDTQLRRKLQRAVLVNFAALAVSTLGLMMVVAGIFLS